MQEFTKSHNYPTEYMGFADRWGEEEFCNICLTLCYQVDSMINGYLKELEQSFVTEGGIKERMHKARTGYRSSVDDRLHFLEQENAQLKQQLRQLNEAYNKLLAQSTPQ